MLGWTLLLLVSLALDETLAYQPGVARVGLHLSADHPGAACPRAPPAAKEQQHSRRSLLLSFAAVSAGFFAAGPAPVRAVEAVIGKDDALPAGAVAPSDAETKIIKDAIQAFDNKQLAKAESLFSKGIDIWWVWLQCLCVRACLRVCMRALPS